MALEKVIIEYDAEIKKLSAKLDAAENKLSKMGDSISKTEKTFSSFGETAKKIGAIIGVSFAVDQILSFGKAAFKSFAEAELSARKLENAVKALGGTNGAFQSLISQSSKLQGLTIFSDEQIQSAQTLALQFGLNAKEVENLIPKIADFASATGQDLSQALEAVLRGVEGSGRALKVYGIEAKTTGDRQTDLANITDQLTKKFEGQSEAIGETAAGRVQKLANAWDDFMEIVGGGISSAITPLFEGLNSLLTVEEGLSDVLKGSQADFNAQLEVLKAGNISQEQRKILITQINDKYKEYLPALITEADTTKTLSEYQKESNEQFMRKIALASREEDIAKATKEIVDLNKQIIRDEIEMVRIRKESSNVRKEGLVVAKFGETQTTRSVLKEGELEDKINKSKKAIADKERELKQITETYRTLFDKLQISEKVKEEEKAVNSSAKSYGELQVTLERLNDLRKTLVPGTKEFIETQKEIVLLTNQIKKATGELTEEEKKQAEEEKKLAKEEEEIRKNKKRLIDAHALTEREVRAALAKEEIEQREADEKATLDALDAANKEDEKARETAKANAETERAIRAETIAGDIAMFEKRAEVASSALDALSNLGAAFAQDAEANAEFQKAIAAFQIAIDTAKAIASVVAAASSTSITPVDLAIKIASGIAVVTANIVAAKQLLSAPVPKAPGFAVGTMDAPGGLAWVGEQGPELMHVPKGAKIFPNDKSSRFEKELKGIFSGNFDDIITRDYIMPALKKRENGGAAEQREFAENIVRSVMLNASFDNRNFKYLRHLKDSAKREDIAMLTQVMKQVKNARKF